MPEHPSVVLPTTVTKVIHNLACLAAHRFLQFGHSRQDLEQEMALHCLRHRHQYDVGLASAATFSARICRHRLSNVYAAERACSRRASGGLTSLSEPVVIGQAGETVLLEDSISADTCRMRLGRQSRPTSELQILAIDLKRVLDQLPSELVSVARLLAEGETPAEAAAILNISRATIYRRIVRIRTAFHDAGFESNARLQEAA